MAYHFISHLWYTYCKFHWFNTDQKPHIIMIPDNYTVSHLYWNDGDKGLSLRLSHWPFLLIRPWQWVILWASLWYQTTIQSSICTGMMVTKGGLLDFRTVHFYWLDRDSGLFWEKTTFLPLAYLNYLNFLTKIDLRRRNIDFLSCLARPP